jgi:hypothetical protein
VGVVQKTLIIQDGTCSGVERVAVAQRSPHCDHSRASQLECPSLSCERGGGVLDGSEWVCAMQTRRVSVVQHWGKGG